MSRNNSANGDLSGSSYLSNGNSVNTNNNNNISSNNTVADGDNSNSRSITQGLARGQSGAETPPRAALMRAVNWRDQSRNDSGNNLTVTPQPLLPPSPVRTHAMPPVQHNEPQQSFGLRGRKLSLEQLLGGDNDDGDRTANGAVTLEDAPQKSEVTATLVGMLILSACLYS